MFPLLIASSTTLGVLIASICTQHKRHFYQYALIFFTCLFFCYAFEAMCYEKKSDYPLTARLMELSQQQDAIIITTGGKKVTQESIMKDFLQQCQYKIDYHFEEGMKCFQEAEQACMWLPDIDDQKKAEMCFSNILAVAIPGSGNAKLVATIIACMATYGPLVMDQWHKIDTKLQQSKMHFELQDFYMEVGKYVENEVNFKRELKYQKKRKPNN